MFFQQGKRFVPVLVLLVLISSLDARAGVFQKGPFKSCAIALVSFVAGVIARPTIVSHYRLHLAPIEERQENVADHVAELMDWDDGRAATIIRFEPHHRENPRMAMKVLWKIEEWYRTGQLVMPGAFFEIVVVHGEAPLKAIVPLDSGRFRVFLGTHGVPEGWFYRLRQVETAFIEKMNSGEDRLRKLYFGNSW